MGGYGSAVAHAAEDAASYLTEGLRKSESGSQAHGTFFSQMSELVRSPEGQASAKMLGDYDMRRNQILNHLQKSPQAVQDVIKNDPAKMKATIGDVHKDLASQNHPAAAHTANIIGLDPKNADLTLKAYTQKLGGQARLLAHAQVIGEDNQNLVNTIMPLYLKNDPISDSHANAILDIAANQFHDTTYPLEVDETGAHRSGVPQSAVKLDMRKALVLENQMRVAGGEKPIAVLDKKFDTSNVYEKQNEIERFSSQRVRWFLAPMIAVNHMSTFFNYSTAPLTAIYKGMATMGDAEIKDLSDASAILGSQHFHMLLDDMNLRTGAIATKTGKPEVAALYGQIFHNPGFNFIRNAQLKLGGAIGYHSALYWTENAMKGDKRSILELKEMGLNPQAILQRGGQLTRDEKVQAIWHFVNNRTFVSRPLDRSLTSQRNPWTRMLTMFHGYVTFQQRFMRRELQKMLQSNDYVGIARYAGTVGLMFPSVAPMLKAAEVFARTANPNQAVTGAKNDYERLSHPENTSQFISEYLDMLSYFGSWGIMHSFITAAHGDRLALALMGPTAGSAVRAAQDAINLTTRSTKSGHHNIKPLAKDILQQTVPVGGNILANQLFPAKTINN